MQEIFDILKSLLVKDKDETADQSYKRLKEAYSILIKEFPDYYSDEYPCSKPVSADEIKKSEDELGVTYPKEFKEFILKYGLVQFDEYDYEFSLPSNPNMYNWLDLENIYDPNFWIYEDNPERLKKVYSFCGGDSDDIISEHCFDFSEDKVTVYDVYTDYDEWNKSCSTGVGFERFMTWAVDCWIIRQIDELDEGEEQVEGWDYEDLKWE